MQFTQFRIATRGLIVQNKKLLFVSDDGHYWYLPGGRVEFGENLDTCLEREIYEETGFIVKTGSLMHVLECLDVGDYTHKIHFFFGTTILQANDSMEWKDEGGSVLFQRFFSLAEIQEKKELVPRFLAKGQWCKLSQKNTTEKNVTDSDLKDPDLNIYQGSLLTKGFEVL